MLMTYTSDGLDHGSVLLPVVESGEQIGYCCPRMHTDNTLIVLRNYKGCNGGIIQASRAVHRWIDVRFQVHKLQPQR
jgi:hypothetical protein